MSHIQILRRTRPKPAPHSTMRRPLTTRGCICSSTKLTFLLTEVSLSELLEDERTDAKVEREARDGREEGREGYEQGRWGTKLEQESDSAVGRGPHSPLSQDAIDGGLHVIHTAWWGGLCWSRRRSGVDLNYTRVNPRNWELEKIKPEACMGFRWKRSGSWEMEYFKH